MLDNTKQKFTPGPWVIDDYNEIRADRPNDRECVLIATVCDAPMGLDYRGIQTRPHDCGERAANERLIAAAPDLLDALRLLVADVADYEAWQRPCHAVDVALAAIAKAED